jgi:hypothetical protein
MLHAFIYCFKQVSPKKMQGDKMTKRAQNLKGKIVYKVLTVYHVDSSNRCISKMYSEGKISIGRIRLVTES